MINVNGMKMTTEDIGRMLSEAEGLDGATRRFIVAVGAALAGAGVLEDTDEGALRMLMLSYDMYVKASAELLRDGPVLHGRRGEPRVNPAEKIAKTYYAQVLAFMREYGLTVRSRERIKSLTPAVDETSELARWLAGGGNG